MWVGRTGLTYEQLGYLCPGCLAGWLAVCWRTYLGDLEELLVVEGAVVGVHELGQHHRGQVADRHLVGARVLDDLRAQVARPDG